MIKNLNLFLYLIIIIISIKSQKAFGQFENFILKKWIVSQKTEVDFNKDGYLDYLIFIDSVDNNNSENKRDILIIHGSINGLYLATNNSMFFTDGKQFIDAEDVSITVKGNVIYMGIGDRSLGLGCNGGQSFTIRFQNNNWYVIGCGWNCQTIVYQEDEIEQSLENRSYSYNLVTGNSEYIEKIDSKVTKKILDNHKIKLPLFSEYNGECESLPY